MTATVTAPQAKPERITLFYREGSSDEVYQASIEPAGELFVVNFAFGRRGSTLNTGTKTQTAVDYNTAARIFTKLVDEKRAKGYTQGPEGYGPSQQGEAVPAPAIREKGGRGLQASGRTIHSRPAQQRRSPTQAQVLGHLLCGRLEDQRQAQRRADGPALRGHVEQYQWLRNGRPPEDAQSPRPVHRPVQVHQLRQ